jgi:hypothetical protein
MAIPTFVPKQFSTPKNTLLDVENASASYAGVLQFQKLSFSHFLLTIAATGSPVLFFTDIVAGPTSGGENNYGAPIRLYGLNFGTVGDLGTSTKVYINNAEIADYKYIGNAKSQPFASYGITLQEIHILPGSIGGLAEGSSGAIKVTTSIGDSNTNLTFFNQPGNIKYVSAAGSDSNDGSFNTPYRYIQNATRDNPAWASFGPGDFIIVRGGNYPDEGWDNRFVRWHYGETGTAPTGVAGSGYYNIIAYPGETPVMQMSVANNNWKGGFVGPASSYYTDGHYVVIAGFSCEDNDSTKADNSSVGPMTCQSSGEYWRVIGNEIQVQIGSTCQKSGGISGGFRFAKIMGNYIHDVQGGGTCPGLNHGMYYDNYSNDVEIAYNNVDGVTDGSIFQMHGNLGCPGCGYPSCNLYNFDVHHNRFANGTGKYGINFSVCVESVNFYNNIIDTTRLPALSLITDVANGVYIFFNTFYNCCTSGNYGAVMNSGHVLSPDVLKISNNIFYANAAAPTYYLNYSTDTTLVLDNNLWFGLGATPPSKDANGIYGDPGFVNAAGGDFTPTAYALNAASDVSADFNVLQDYMFNTRPTTQTQKDIGAIEVQ